VINIRYAVLLSVMNYTYAIVTNRIACVSTKPNDSLQL